MSPDFTRSWWSRCLADPAKLAAWLQKLQRTELGGYVDHLRFMADNAGALVERERKILTHIAEDELKHSVLLVDMMNARGIAVVPDGVQSTYWDEILTEAKTFKAYCAANYYGEALAAERFEIILGMATTPSDIREVLGKALPDEIFHRETLVRLAGPEQLEIYRVKHEQALARLTGRAA